MTRGRALSAAGAGVLALATAGAVSGAPVAHAVEDEDTRPLFRLEDPAIDSSSGLAVSSDDRILYTMQDAGKQNAVFALDRTGQTRMTLTLPGVRNEDWEDVASGVDEQGRAALFLSDMGDAYFTRRKAGEPARRAYSIYRFTQPDARVDQPPSTQDVQDLVRYPVVYDDHAARNSEALAIQPRTNRVFVVDKVVETVGTATVWQAPSTLSPTTDNGLSRIAQIPVAQVTAASFSPDGKTFAVRDYRYAYFWRMASADLAVALREQPRVVTLPPQSQGEGLAFDTDGHHVLVNSEGKNTLVWQVPVPAEPVQPGAAPVATTQSASAPPDRAALWLLGLTTVGVLTLAGARWRTMRSHAAPAGPT